MTNQEKTEAILKAIREACPELMELSFGCEVKWRKRSINEHGHVIHVHHKHVLRDNNSFSVKSTGSCTTDNIYPVEHDLEIIGHEPHLEHLLRAMYKSQVEKYRLFAIEVNGVFNEWKEDGYQDSNGVHYDFTLSLRQNLETNQDLTDFLYKLLVKQ